MKSPGPTVVTVLTLALAIGANTAIFSLLNSLVLRSLPVSHPEQLVHFGGGHNCCMLSGIARHYDLFSYEQYKYFRDESNSFAGVLAAAAEYSPVGIRRGNTGANSGHAAVGTFVSGNYFSVLGVMPSAGRVLSANDDLPGSARAAVISYAYWTKEYSRSAQAIGQAVQVNGKPFTIVGVASREFFGERIEAQVPDIWLPISAMPELTAHPASLLRDPDQRWLQVIGRLAPGTSVTQAQSQVNGLLQRFLRATAGSTLSDKDRRKIEQASSTLVPARHGISRLRARYSEPLRFLTIMAGLLLLMACANLASMRLAEASTRNREFGVRVALGASPARLMWQMLLESFVLAVAGALAGLFVAFWAVRGLLALVLRGVENTRFQVALDLHVLAYLFLLTLLCVLFFGLGPALKASRAEVLPLLSGRTSSEHGRLIWCRKLLVAGQFALALLLLVNAGLFVRSLKNLLRQDFGFAQNQVLLLHIDPKVSGYDPQQLQVAYDRIRLSINALPGVRSSALALYTPLSGTNWVRNIAIQEYSREQNRGLGASWARVSPQYFETMGIPVLLGRSIGEQDTLSSPKVAVINQSMARRFFPNENPIGRRFGWSIGLPGELEIVGVAKDTKHSDPRTGAPPMFFVPFGQMTENPDGPVDLTDSYAQDLVVRCSGDPISMAAAVRHAVQQADGNIPVLGITTMATQTRQALKEDEIIGALSAGFGFSALLLVSVGLYGLMSYVVSRRTKEIGIRIALGAPVSNVRWMVLRDAGVLACLGGALGLPLTFATQRLFSSRLFGLGANDPATVIAAIFLLGTIALLAAYVPARRATRVDPMVALRCE